MIFDTVPGPRRQEHDLIGQIDRFFDAMGDEDHGLLLMPEQIQKLFLKLPPRLLIDGGKWLVHQDNIGIDAKRARKSDPLAHAARKLVRITRLENL